MSTIRFGASSVAALILLAAAAPTASAQTYRTTRPIHGVWLRGPAALTGVNSLDTNLQNFASAGITDLFLDTLYYGLTVGKQGVFNSWYSSDYLQSAITASAKYGIRVHAWCESALLQYGTTGRYNFTVNPAGQSVGDPAWLAISSATGQSGGDYTDPNMVFGNLAHPGLQAKLRTYFAELAGYPGLWGIQTDYHRYPLDANSSDANPAPWSFDAYSRNAFMAIYGPANDPLLKAISTSGSSGTQYTNFLNWRKAQITEAARQMKLGIDPVDSGIEFSAAMFAVPVTAKCSDWASWASNGYVDWLVPMCYGSSTSSITNDLTIVKNASSGRRVIAGLYTDSTSGHPTISQQLTAANSVSVQDWVFFSGPTFTVAANRSTILTFITGTTQKQRGDFNNDGYIDSTDWTLFRALYNGTPVSAAGANARFNYNGDSQITEADWTLFKSEFARWHFGEDGVVDQRSLDAFLQCMNASQGTSSQKHLYDLDGNGVVNYQDQLILHSLLTTQIAPDTDVNSDGRMDINDLYALNQNLNRDVNRDGVIDTGDIAELDKRLQMER
jgi:uncharacterized lipoprotein YddW (UPF0748 family)